MQNLKDITSRKDISTFLNAQGLTNFGVEVGVLRGDFSKHILSTWTGKKLYLVDAWRQFDSNVDINNGNHIVQLQNIAECFKNIYEFKERAVIIRETSRDASNLFPDGSLDFVYIDSAHDYEHTLEDLNIWYPKIRKGGLFCGDDYLDGLMLNPGATVFGVESAVTDFAKEKSLEIVSTTHYGEFPQWWCIK